MNTRTTQYATSAKWPDDVQSVTTQPLKYAADMVLLARRCSLNYVLKRALYELVRAEGFRQETNPNSEDDDEIDSGRSSLSASDYSLLLHAREQLTIFWMKMALSHPQVSGCTSPKESDDYEDCAVTTRKVRSIYIILMHESNIFENYRYDPICGLVGQRREVAAGIWEGSSHHQIPSSSSTWCEVEKYLVPGAKRVVGRLGYLVRAD